MAKGRWKKGEIGNPGGRRKGAKDKVPRGSVVHAFRCLYNEHDGVTKMVDAMVKAYGGKKVDDRKLALGYTRLGLQVDALELQRSAFDKGVVFIVNGINPAALRPSLPEEDSDGE